MEFRISEKSQKRLDDMIFGYMKTKESEKELQRMKTQSHLIKYHFKTFDDIIEYLQSGNKLLFEDVYSGHENECIIYNDETEMIELWKNDKSKINWDKSVMSIDEFRDFNFFALLEDGSGYIKRFHRDI